MEFDGTVDVAVDLPGCRGRGRLRHPHAHELVDQFVELCLWVQGELGALHLDLCVDLLVLRRHRGELAECHRERTGDEACDARQDDGVRAGTRTADTRDEADVGDETVHRAEGRRAHSAAGDVGVGVADLLGVRHRFAHVVIVLLPASGAWHHRSENTCAVAISRTGAQ